MPRAFDMISPEEIETVSPVELYDQVERLQEENQRLETLLEEACDQLTSVLEAGDDDLGDLRSTIEQFLTNRVGTY